MKPIVIIAMLAIFIALYAGDNKQKFSYDIKIEKEISQESLNHENRIQKTKFKKELESSHYC